MYNYDSIGRLTGRNYGNVIGHAYACLDGAQSGTSGTWENYFYAKNLYVLLSISNGSESILDEQHVFSYYWDRLLTNLILSCIFDGIALLLVIAPPIYCLIVRRKEQAKKRRNKQKKLQKKLQMQQKRASQNQDDRKG